MKKISAILLAIICLCSLVAVPANAAQDPMTVKFQEALDLLDYFYDYNAEYMIRVANDQFVSYDNMGPVTVPAAEYEAVLHKHFVIDDAMIAAIRMFDEYACLYDAAAQTYTVQYTGGFGGSLAPREYLGYVKNGETYDVYYRHLTYGYLSDVLPEGTNEYAYAESLGYPSSIEYNGVVYESGPDGYVAILSRDNFGRKYTVEMNGDTVRIISCVEYTEGQQPDTFDDAKQEVIYDIPADSGVSIPENECFSDDTTVKVEQVVSGTTFETVNEAMEAVAEKYVAFEFTATKNNTAVQPNGKLAVTFAIPEGYSDNVAVYYMAQNGTLEKLSATVNAADRTVTAQLEHFSTYILADESSKPEQKPQESTPPETEPPATEPPVTEPAQTEPSETAPTQTEPAQTEPSQSAPAETTPVETTPVGTNPAGQGGEADQPDLTGVIVAVVAIVIIAAGVAVFVVTRKKK